MVSEGEGALLVYFGRTGEDTGSRSTTFTDGELTVGIRHVCQVEATGVAGLGEWTNLVGATPLDPTGVEPKKTDALRLLLHSCDFRQQNQAAYMDEKEATAVFAMAPPGSSSRLAEVSRPG